jgi:hypothetical protein
MSSLVFVEDENNDLLDEWMNNESGFAKGDPDVMDASASLLMQTNNEDPSSKGGLGFVVSAEEKRNKAAAAEKSKVLQRIATKKQELAANKRYRENEITHGVVEDLEESRTSVVSKKTKMEINKIQAAKKPAPAVDCKSTTGTGTIPAAAGSKKVAPLQKGNGGNIAAQKAVASSNVNHNEKPKNSSGASNSGDNTNKPGEAEKQDDRLNSRKRKRVKTRSKQKNILKDNRSEFTKPAHLLPGHAEFKGRPLTQQTKQKLGISSSGTTAAKP